MAVDPNIPSVPSTVPTDQAPWFTAVKGCIEILMGQGRNTDANRALRVSEYRAGITKIQESLPEHILAQSMDIPAPPTNLIVTKGVWSHHLTWDNPTDEIVSHIEIWVATNSQDRSNAVIRGIVTVTENLRGKKGGFDFSGLDVTADLVYWIRSISYAGNHSIWEPPDDQGGYVVPGNETLDETINDIMDILKGSITEDQLYIDLSSRIDLIDFPATGLIDRIAGMDFTINNPATGLIDRIAGMDFTINNPATGLIDRIADMNFTINNPATGLIDRIAGMDFTINNPATGLIDRIAGMDFTINNPATGLIDRIADMNFTISNPATGLIDRIATMEVAIESMPLFESNVAYFIDDMVTYSGKIYVCIQDTNVPPPLPTDTSYWEQIGSSASIAGEVSANALEINRVKNRVVIAEGGITAISESFTALQTDVGGNTSAIQTERQTRAAEDEALATSIDTLFAFTDTNDNEAAIQIEREARVSEDEALAREATLMETRFGESHAALSQEIETRTGPESALATSIDTLTSTVGANTAAIQIEQTTRAAQDEALATNVTTLSASLDKATETTLLSWEGSTPIRTNATHNQAEEWLFDSAFDGGALAQIQVTDGYIGDLKVSLNGQLLVLDRSL